MDPIIDNDWLNCKSEPTDEPENVSNIVRSWQWRERGINPLHGPSNKTVLENVAEDILVQKRLKIRRCDLPGFPRSTFLMVFSPDGTKLASTHGNHNVYVSELASGKHVRILRGHPRTPWCIAFHPSHTQLIGSGCLGGQVRVWDLSGGSETWTVERTSVIASIAFHPRDQLLAIATYNELYFWDWSQPAPFIKVSTNSYSEKVRYVAFDSLGYKLITGITVWGNQSNATSIGQNTTQGGGSNTNNQDNDNGNSPGDNTRSQDNSETIVNSYQHLVQRYDSLVRNYQRLFMARYQLSSPPAANTTDRGTDPMETDFTPTTSTSARTILTRDPHERSSGRRERRRSQTSRDPSENSDSQPGPSRRRNRSENTDDNESRSQLLNLDFLSINTPPSIRSLLARPSRPIARPSRPVNRPAEAGTSLPHLDRPVFGSSSSAFQPLSDSPSRRMIINIPEEEERVVSRLLPNPFSSTSTGRLGRSTVVTQSSDPSESQNTTGSSRTNVFVSQVLRSRLSFDRRRHGRSTTSSSRSPTVTNTTASHRTPILSTAVNAGNSSRPSNNSQRPGTTNSSTQMSPESSQSINESLDLIRDILRDSGTRLLNLITNMSLSTLANVERSMPRSPNSGNPPDDGQGSSRSRSRRPRVRLFSSNFRREFLFSGSDSDSDSLEVNIYRTRNSSFPEDGNETDNSPTTERSTSATNRMIVNLNLNTGEDDQENNESSQDSNDMNRIDITVSNNRFRVRTQSGPQPSTSTDNVGTDNIDRPPDNDPAPQNEPLDLHLNQPSTSRDTSWMNDPLNLSTDSPRGSESSRVAFIKVKAGVQALEKHTSVLTDIWMRGSRTSLQDLRKMWEDLRRRFLALQRQTGRNDVVPSHFARSIMERCRMLTEMSRNPTSSRGTSSNSRGSRTNNATNTDNDSLSPNQNQQEESSSDLSTVAESSSSTSTASSSGTIRPNTNTLLGTRTRPTLANTRNVQTARRRLQSSYRWRPGDDMRRRTQLQFLNRWCIRNNNRQVRRDTMRSVELHHTRSEIRVRAMQVLTIMFNMMLSCLEERGLSQIIIHMLRTLKKALSLTCLLLVTNIRREPENRTPNQEEGGESMNVDEGENAQANTTPTDNQNPATTTNAANIDVQSDTPNVSEPIECNVTTAHSPTQKKNTEQKDSENNTTDLNNEDAPSTSQRWSDRLAIQISAANRNYSATARSRRDLYLARKRQKALHKFNPSVPLIRKRTLPPSFTYRIPALRYLSSKAKTSFKNNKPRNNDTAGPSKTPSASLSNVQTPGPSNDRPVSPSILQAPGPSNLETEAPPNVQTAGPSTSQPEVNQSGRRPPIAINNFERRFNLYRMAHMQAVRLRNVARNRYRRLHAIRLYAPHRMQDVLALQINDNENEGENQSNEPNEASEASNGRANRESGLSLERLHRFESVLSNIAVPLVRVNNLSGNEGQDNQPPDYPIVQEYLQPIILAQNAVVLEEAGADRLLEAGLIPEPLTTPTHRVQAWDFTSGLVPDIADNTKNVVVSQCRIHNDASIDISKDGRLLVALLPVTRLRSINHRLGVYSLEWARLGQCLYTAALEHSAVSVALSPTARHLAVGLGSRRFSTLPHTRHSVFAQLFRLGAPAASAARGLQPVKELQQDWEQGFTSLNCLRWAPQPGQGLVYANNTGQLVIMS